MKNKHILSAIVLLAATQAAAQENLTTVTGQVVDAATGKPLAGVMVAAYGEARYTSMTDDEGRYELKLPEYVRSVSMRVDGYNMVQTAINNGHADARLYNSTFFKADYSRTTTATISAEANNFENTSELSIDPLLAQQLGADMRTVSHGGTPGMGQLMLIEGINSLNANAQPLVVLDGVIFDMQYNRGLLHDGFFNNMLTNLNVNDIESVEVLKNGTALYGAKGANGVLVINTKRNKSMATKIDVTVNGRFELMPRLPQMMNAEDYRLYATELLSAKKNPNELGKMKFLNSEPDYFYYPQYHNQTDWKDEVYRNTFSQNYGINVQGGDDAASYNLSVGFAMGNSTLKRNDYSRFNMRLNSDISVARWLDVRFDASYSDVDRALFDDGAPADPLNSVITSPGFLALAKSPFLSPFAYDNYGNLSHYYAEADDYLEGMFQGRGRLANPSSILEFGEGKNRNSFGNRLITFAITPKFKIGKHVTLLEHFTLNLINTNENQYLPIKGVPTFTVEGLDEDTQLQNIVQSMAARQTTIQSDTRVTWQNRYDAHNIDVKAGFRYFSSNYDQTTLLGYNTGNDKTPFMSSALRNAGDEGVSESWNNMSWYAQAEYSYKSRYYLQASLAVDGSSRFGKDADGLKVGGVAWGVFPGVQASWVITNEPWMAGISGIDYLRLTAGYDISGNDDIDIFAASSYFSSTQFLHSVTALAFEGIGNNKVQWETTRRFNIGLESDFLNNRLNLGLNYFRSSTSNLLMHRALGFLSGLDENWVNGGKLQNEGFDVTATVKVLALKDWQWQVGASVGHYKNKITELADGLDHLDTEVYGATVRTQVGQASNLFYGYKTDGVYATTADAVKAGLGGKPLYIVDENGVDLHYYAAGDMKFLDLQRDGVINEHDMTVIGDPNPDIYGNIFTTVAWKRLKLDVNFNYSLGNDVYNYMRSQLEGGQRFMNQTTALQRRWQAEGQHTDIPRVTFQDPMGNARFSDRWIEDGSYLRLKSVTLSYDLPLKSEYIQGLQFWVRGNNLLTFTKYLGSDPEFSMTSSVIGQGIDLGHLSQSRSIVAGVKINL